jgi:RNase P/RNase MRP subunit POP5
MPIPASEAKIKEIVIAIGLTQNISQTLISPCTLRLCGSLRQAEASTLFRNSCVSPKLVKFNNINTEIS